MPIRPKQMEWNFYKPALYSKKVKVGVAIDDISILMDEPLKFLSIPKKLKRAQKWQLENKRG